MARLSYGCLAMTMTMPDMVVESAQDRLLQDLRALGRAKLSGRSRKNAIRKPTGTIGCPAGPARGSFRRKSTWTRPNEEFLCERTADWLFFGEGRSETPWVGCREVTDSMTINAMPIEASLNGKRDFPR